MVFRLLIPVLLALALGGCAFINPQNTPLLTTLDAAVKPDTAWSKIALGPVFVPVGVGCALLDIGVVHPLHSVWLAAVDTRDALWAKSSGSFAEQALMAVPKAAVTPVVFAFCWLGESLFDLRKPKADAERTPAQ